MTPNTNYVRGRNTEYKAKKELEAEGYYCSRSSGSHSAIDLWCVSPLNVKVIQLKRTKSKYFTYKKDIEQLQKLKVPSNCSKELWIWLDRKGWIKKVIV